MRLFVYYFLNVILSILLGIFLIQQKKIIFIVILIFISLLILKNKFSNIVRLILIILSFISFINIISYYSIQNDYVSLKQFRVVNKNSKDVILKSRDIISRKYIIKDFENLDDIKIGMILNLDGEIKKLSYYDVGIVGEIKNYKINEFKTDFIYKFINMKNVIKDFFVMKFGDEKGNILSGLTFGDTSGLDKEYKNDLKSLGLVHILSVSGFHMNLIFMFISKILSVAPSLFISFLYLMFTGVKVSGIRAFTMMFLKQTAPKLYRTYDGINALCVAGVIILLLRPYEIFNMGFVYSFSATLGILMFNRKINDYFYKMPKLLADSVSLILSAQIFIFPISILIERKLEFGFLLSNMLLVPFYSVLMIFGILFVFFGMVPIVNEIILYLINFIFAVIDGGILFIKIITPKGIYLNDYIIIFILCLYVIYFLSKKVSYNKIKNIPILLFGLCFIFLNVFDLKVEFGKYFDKNYVILRNKFRSYMYVDKKIKDTQTLEEKLGVDKVFQDVDEKEIMFSNKRININFNDDKIYVEINRRQIDVLNEEHTARYYSDIYPNKYYVIF
ncbi:ComEC/Rec2 family competence protein [Candidatus Arthromitus sp. SFB-turkey]|uniref:ComEC/Rec2 family competence protein n=1 Tax=Candidatus Arthromitus sp. SFB-turkey TaxID=1840217 RepID=UPI0007F3E0B2|nr:ComEC/Rec2 family competence protein [Candidatus Arthromitus sp. SFB-turkey]OAT86925.1 competence protein ComEC [Candidatus Arthromitus sp. SFB-turkey]